MAHNDSVELTGRPADVRRSGPCPGRPAAHFRRYAATCDRQSQNMINNRSIVPCFCVLFFMLPVAGTAQTAIYLKAAGAGYSASDEQGFGWGLSVAAAVPVKSVHIGAEVGASFLEPFDQECTLGIPGSCLPDTPPKHILEAGVSAIVRPVRAIELRGGGVLIHRVYNNSANAGIGFEGAVAVSFSGDRFGIEVRNLLLLDSPQGWLASVRLRYRL